MSQLSFEMPGTLSEFERVLIWCDGACRGNPGHASIGVVLRDGTGGKRGQPGDFDGPVIDTISEYIGETTNNVAEYQAAIAGLQRGHALGARTVELRADSLLVINQLLGRWKVKQPHLVPLHRAACAALGEFESTALIHIPREENGAADALANAALDARRAERP